jgi:hypothetical protein
LLPPDRPPAFFRVAKYLLLTGVVIFAASTVLVPLNSSAKPILDGWIVSTTSASALWVRAAAQRCCRSHSRA